MRGGNFYLIFVGLLLCAAGGSFGWLMWRSFDRASGQRDWAETTCTILESRVDQRKIGVDVGTEYNFGVLYGYSFGNKAYSSERFSLRGAPWSSSESRARKRMEKFPQGSIRPCYVDPDDPAFAVLKLDSKAPGYSLWFPLIFVVGGLGIIGGTLRSGRKARAEGGRDDC